MPSLVAHVLPQDPKNASILFFHVCMPKGDSWSPAFVAGTAETWNKNCSVTGAMHVLWRKCEVCQAFPAFSVHELYRLKVLITLEQVNSSVVEKKENLNKQNLDGEAHWSGVVNFRCMQMRLVMTVQFIFSDDWNQVPRSSHVCLLAMM